MKSEHPLAEALVEYAKMNEVQLSKVEDFESVTGKGVFGYIDGKRVVLGSERFLNELAIDTGITTEKSGIFMAVEFSYCAQFIIEDPIKKTSIEALKALKNENIHVVMLSGDSEVTAKKVATKLGINEIYADVLPDGKIEVIKKLQESGAVVAMAGDGINDAPALAQADVGIAMGTGTDVAIESAGVTLIKGDLLGIVKVLKLSRATMKNIRQNLFFAFVYNSAGVPVAAGVLYPLFGLLLSPVIAAAAMSFSSVSVIVNALRLKNTKI